MKSSWTITIASCLCLVLGMQVAHAAAQETPAPADEVATDPAVEPDQDDEKKKRPIGLYVEVGTGSSSADPLDLSIRSAVGQSTVSSMTFEDMDTRRAALGWRLPNGKGSFRAIWNGMNESGYEFNSVGRASAIDPDLAINNAIVENLDWWTVDVVDGALTTVLNVPQWTIADDANGDNAVQRGEVFYNAPEATLNGNYAPDLENRIQTLDLVYGRDFGPRRIQGRWWTGLRYYAYEGTLLQSAWLRNLSFSQGFTDGQVVRLLTLNQKASAIGPTGSLGFNVNFFNQKLQLFTNFQIAFMLADVEVDSGEFFFLVPSNAGSTNDTLISFPARLAADRSRTNWNTHADAGIRLNIKGGLSIEMTYFIDGFLDTLLTPAEIRVPGSVQSGPQGISALFSTQDFVIDGWRASVAFQF
jgi:hypothetical protein